MTRVDSGPRAALSAARMGVRFAIAASSLTLLACPPSTAKLAVPPEDLVIGVVAPLTGPDAAYGVSVKHGIDFAIEEANATGGVLGRRVRAVHLDDRGEREAAADATQRLITREKVAVILGGVSSSASGMMAPIAQRARTPMITPSATAPRLTEQGPFIFRVCFSDPFQAEAMARFAQESLRLERIAVMRDVGSPYSVILADAFGAALAARGTKVVADEAYAREDESFETSLSKLRAANAQALYIPGYRAELERITRAVKEMGWSVTLLGADGWDTHELRVGAGDAIEGAYYTTHFARDEPRPAAGAFVQAYERAMNEAPDAQAALGYDAARFALAGIQSAKSTDHEAVREALARMTHFEGATGALQLTASGDAVKAAVVVRIVDGTPQFVATVPPP